MSCQILVTHAFAKEAKRLGKKYASFKGELVALQEQLIVNPRMGVLLFEHTYKIRLAVKSKGKGKSGGLRIITHIIEIEMQVDEQEADTRIYLAFIYDKSDAGTVDDDILREMVAEIHAALEEE